VKSKYELDRVTQKGLTAAALAAYHGHTKCLELLAEGGGDISKTSAEGLSPLYLAIKKKNGECVKLLVEKGACLYYE